MAEFPILHDEPALDDLLDRQKQVRELGDLIARCQPPQVFGVHGDWGSGKTSFLQQLQWYLSGDKLVEVESPPESKLPGGQHEDQVTTVWFEAWRYQRDGAPIVALLHEIRSQLPWRSKAFREAGKLFEVSLRSALLSIEDLTKKIGIQASKIQETGERWERENVAVALPSHVIRQHLEDALSKLLGRDKAKGRRLVVLIDDLDRCKSEAAYALLEGVKIYLNLPSCIFVLGMNQKVIEDAIAEEIPSYQKDGDRGPRRRAREYLEKLCQNSAHLPVLENSGKLLAQYLRAENIDLAGYEAIRSVIEEFDCLPRNARRIKAFANLLRRQATSIADRLGNSKEPDRDTKLLVLMNVLYRFHPEIYRLLETYSAEFYAKLRRWCRNPGEDGHHLLLHGLPTPEGAIEVQPDSPTSEPSTGRELLFPDPSESHVFRAQKLVLDLGQVTKDEIHRHLVR